MNLLDIDRQIKTAVDTQLDSFRALWANGTENEIFTELLFCLCTPQSKARQAEKAVNLMREQGLLFSGDREALVPILSLVRFKNQKAESVLRAQARFIKNGIPTIKAELAEFQNPFEMRVFLTETVHGMGWKEASHFLRNIGLGADLAILDRHILRNMVTFGIIDEPVKAATGKNYRELELKLTNWSEQLGIPMDRLDYVLWYKEAQDIFK